MLSGVPFVLHPPAFALPTDDEHTPKRREPHDHGRRVGLALAGFPHYVHEARVQIVGQSELQFLGQLSAEGRRAAVAKLELEKISCVLVTKGLMPPAELVEACEAAVLPLIRTTLVSSTAITAITEYLEELLAPRETRHGVLL